MPINVYTGLMRSGKSFEVVSQVIIEAIAKGRRVVTNVDGISNDLVRAYVVEHRKVDSEKLGTVVHVQNEDVFKPDFFPYYDDHHGEHIDTMVLPGDLVCIDEAWRFWGTDSKLHKHHKSFFLEHGHFTHPETGVACDLVLMIQDMGTLHRFVKAVVAFCFRTHKKVSLGMGNTYSVTMWEGSKQIRAAQIGNWVRRYDKAIFPLYSSFKDGADGKMVNADARQNIFTDRWLWIKFVLLLVVAFFSFRGVWKFFHPEDVKKKEAETKAVALPAVPVSLVPPPPEFSSDWRYSGELKIGNEVFAIITNEAGLVRLSNGFYGKGFQSVGVVDGQRVTAFSGGKAVRGSFLGNLQSKPAGDAK